MSRRSYDGPELDGTVQHLAEAPYWGEEGETVDVVDDSPVGEEQAENVPLPDGAGRPDGAGQTTLDEWGWSA